MEWSSYVLGSQSGIAEGSRNLRVGKPEKETETTHAGAKEYVPDLTVKGGGSVKASLLRFGHKV
jgi:hypothetical protein